MGLCNMEQSGVRAKVIVGHRRAGPSRPTCNLDATLFLSCGERLSGDEAKVHTSLMNYDFGF